MDSSSSWIDMKGKKYKVFEFFRMNQTFRNIELKHCHMAAAAYGGPIAVTRNADHIVIMRSDDLT